MSSAKPLSSRQISPIVSRALKIIGVVIALAALVDIIVLPYPFQFLDRQWQINFVTLAVDRGIVPLVGLALLLTGYWVDIVSGLGADSRPYWKDFLGFWGLILASVLGLFFLLSFPLHLNNVRINNGQALERVNQEATQAESQLNTRLQTEVGQQRQQIEQLLANPEQLKQALDSGQVPEEQAKLLRQFQKDPKSLDTFVSQRVDQLRQQFQTEIGVRREQALKNAKAESLKSGLRIGISSILLAIGYISVGWIGLRNWQKSGSSRVAS